MQKQEHSLELQEYLFWLQNPPLVDQLQGRQIQLLLPQLQQLDKPDSPLRVFVQGGGCAGFQYGLELDDNITEQDDVFESNGVKLIVDRMSQLYLFGSEIRFRNELGGYSYSIENPKAYVNSNILDENIVDEEQNMLE